MGSEQPGKPPRFWKIAPGEKAMYWKDCLDGRFICIGWDKLGDLNQYRTQADLAAACKRLWPREPKAPSQIWDFKNLAEGNQILANKGISGIVGVGEVSGTYEFRPERERFKNCVPVRWRPVDIDLDSARKADKEINAIVNEGYDRWPFRTVKELTSAQFHKLIGNISDQQVRKKMPNIATELSTHSNSQSPQTNLILYGPPGTGKTYETIERSVKIIDPAFRGDHAAYKQKFDQLMREQRIAFITFHQSYSYEDFVEGIRPVLDQEGAEPRYECRAGIFKELAVKALFDCLEPAGTTPPTEGTYTEKRKAEIVQNFLTKGENGTHKLKPKSQQKPYVLIIDEINRGNISKILGELITLIEADKRLGKGDNQNSLIVTLPYSGNKFAVPPNLFLLATMNTADKSIALVDVALRRRFEFEELSVDLQVCANLTDRMRSALKELNQRIMLRKDRDHQIGHAYFMDVTDDPRFNQTFRRRIIPLLQEYFYNDWDGLRYILGENSKADGDFIHKTPNAAALEVRTKWQWFFDAGTDDLNCLQTLCDNFGIA